ncbi:hypothetical protein EFM12_04820 [Latilactobacillus curvatus]|nr:hypothetical protein [Latilactobacillus curvatus]
MHQSTQAKQQTSLLQQYYQFLARSLKQPLKVQWQWANLWFGLVTFGLVILMNTATASLLIASWSEQVGAVAGVMASQIVLRLRPNLLPLDMKALGGQLFILVVIVGIGFLLKRYLLKKTTTTLRAYLTEISAYSGITVNRHFSISCAVGCSMFRDDRHLVRLNHGCSDVRQFEHCGWD